jgi:hypothetical protein
MMDNVQNCDSYIVKPFFLFEKRTAIQPISLAHMWLMT